MTEHTTVEGTTGWTIETLKEWVDQRFADNQTAVSSALLAAKEAVIKAEISTEKRFDSVSETMAKVASQSADLMPRAEYVANHKALDDKIAVVDNAINKTAGERNIYATHADVAAVVETIQATIKPIIDYVNQQKGQASGSQITMGKIYATLGVFTAVLGIIIYFVSQISK